MHITRHVLFYLVTIGCFLAPRIGDWYFLSSEGDERGPNHRRCYKKDTLLGSCVRINRLEFVE